MLRKKLTEIQQKIWKIERNCKHNIEQVGANPKFNCEGFAECQDCNSHFGWWCPNSPDHICHYFTHEVEAFLIKARAVELVDGAEHIIHDYQGDPEYETDDVCVFCHEHEERK